MLRHTEAKLAVSLDRPRPPKVGSKGSIWFPEQESIPIFWPELTGLERYYVPIVAVKLTSSEWDQLEKVLGAGISLRYRLLIEHAIEHLVASYCLKDRAPKLSELKERVREIKNASESLLKLCMADPVDILGKQKSKQKSISRGIGHHVLSISQIVNQYLVHAPPIKQRSLRQYLEPVRILAQICEEELQRIEQRAPKAGAPGDIGLEYLVIALVFAACRATRRTDLKLPSAKTKTYKLSNYPLLAFIKEAIVIGAEKGTQAIASKTDLTPDEVRVAIESLDAARNTVKDHCERSNILDWANERLLFEQQRKPR
jgi:hypothetical protein